MSLFQGIKGKLAEIFSDSTKYGSARGSLAIQPRSSALRYDGGDLQEVHGDLSTFGRLPRETKAPVREAVVPPEVYRQFGGM